MNLEQEFSHIANVVRENNKDTIIFDRMVPFLRTHFLDTEGYLKTDRQLHELAISMFELAQENGILDDLNNVIEEIKV